MRIHQQQTMSARARDVRGMIAHALLNCSYIRCILVFFRVKTTRRDSVCVFIFTIVHMDAAAAAAASMTLNRHNRSNHVIRELLLLPKCTALALVMENWRASEKQQPTKDVEMKDNRWRPPLPCAVPEFVDYYYYFISFSGTTHINSIWANFHCVPYFFDSFFFSFSFTVVGSCSKFDPNFQSKFPHSLPRLPLFLTCSRVQSIHSRLIASVYTIHVYIGFEYNWRFLHFASIISCCTSHLFKIARAHKRKHNNTVIIIIIGLACGF